MRIGVSLLFQNFTDWDRFTGGQFSKPATVSDATIYEEELRLGGLAEPLGFDSIWAPEHHFTPFTMTCNTLQIMSYFAGRTERVDMGTMVVVLPWHDPIRVAEEISVLDNLLGDRRLLIGFGRGMADVEFEGFQVPANESRGRMEESLEIVRLALTQERFSFDGNFFHFPEMSIRPQTRTPDLSENMFGTWASPDSMKYWASSGVGQMFVAASSWETTAVQANAFNAIRAEHGWDPVSPMGHTYVFCAEDESQARELGAKYVGNMMSASLDHYKLLQVPAIVKMFLDQSGDGPPPSEEEVRAAMIGGFVDAAVIGTPKQCAEKMATVQRGVNAAEFMCSFRFGGMPLDEAERSMRLFARDVLPALHEISVAPPLATSFALVQASRKTDA